MPCFFWGEKDKSLLKIYLFALILSFMHFMIFSILLKPCLEKYLRRQVWFLFLKIDGCLCTHSTQSNRGPHSLFSSLQMSKVLKDSWFSIHSTQNWKCFTFLHNDILSQNLDNMGIILKLFNNLSNLQNFQCLEKLFFFPRS